MSPASRAVAAAPLWAAAQWIGLALTPVLLVALVFWPRPALALLWYVVIPVLPATFLVSAQIWRNVCPLATLNTLTGNRIGSRRLDALWMRSMGGAGVLLLAVMVPARRFVFNTDGPVLALTVLAVALLALIGGIFFDKKGGFCNAVCPVLPVERLYGQRPLLRVPNTRCQPCSSCTRIGCLDLAPQRSVLRMLGEAYMSRRWVVTAYGAFALAFPGFVAAYYLLEDGPPSTALQVYGSVLIWSAGSWLVLSTVFLLLRVPSARALLLCAVLAVGLYYWFVPAGIAGTFGLPTSFTWGVRALALTLVGFWLNRALVDPPPARQYSPSR